MCFFFLFSFVKLEKHPVELNVRMCMCVCMRVAKACQRWSGSGTFCPTWFRSLACGANILPIDEFPPCLRNKSKRSPCIGESLCMQTGQ